MEQRHPLWRVLPLALVIAGAAGGVGAWVEYRRAPPVIAEEVPVSETLGSPELSGGQGRRELDQYTARAVIIGLQALSAGSSLETPTANEAKTVLPQIRAAALAYGTAFGLEALDLPSCPEGPPQEGAKAWSGDCAAQWAVLGWTPPLDEGQDPEDVPETLCRYTAAGTGPLKVEIQALCAPGYGSTLERYQLTESEAPVALLPEPE